MADAVSWQAGAMSSVSLKGGEIGERSAERPRTVPAGNNAGRCIDRDAEQVEKLRGPSCRSARSTRPVWVALVYSATRRRPQPVKHVLGQTEPAARVDQCPAADRRELVEGVDAQRLRAGAAKSVLRTKRIVSARALIRWCAHRDNRMDRRAAGRLHRGGHSRPPSHRRRWRLCLQGRARRPDAGLRRCR